MEVSFVPEFAYNQLISIWTKMSSENEDKGRTEENLSGNFISSVRIEMKIRGNVKVDKWLTIDFQMRNIGRISICIS